MNAPTTQTATNPSGTVPRTIGLHGRVAVLSAMAGGIVLGGVLVAAMTLAGRLSGNAIFATATALFVVGAALGLVHGVVLGFFGRPAAVTPREAGRDLGRAGLYAIPALAVAWLAAIWVAMTLVAFYTGRMGPLAGAAVGWLAAGTILAVAAVQGFRALQNAYARWPERRAGTLLASASFAALLLLFLSDRPEIWGIRLRLTETGAVLLAAFLAVWVALPVVTVALRLARSVPFPRPLADFGAGRMTAADLGLGLVVGLVAGLLAVPFAGPAAPAAAGALVVEVSQAVVNEVLLRLFLVTAVAWLLLRWHRVKANEALVGAVLAAALVQVLIYAPGAVAIGFASWTGTALFLIMAVAIPATAFGMLFWKRGFATALVADIAALAAIAFLA
ncbi:MAG: hypothetical protein Q8N53_17755 [Longimicrobiales bacterium]|nr:hypothetical protein [Longimicrobiales bacterium]